jgi:hypothetical protein
MPRRGFPGAAGLRAGAWLALAPVAQATRVPRKLALRHDGCTACVSGGADASI